MKIKQMEADLYCIHCKGETEHCISYVNEKLSSVKCEECEHEIEFNIDVTRELYKEIFARISTKPARMTKEYREDLSQLLFSLPIRVISKPYRLLKDIKQSRNVIKGYKSKKKS